MGWPGAKATHTCICSLEYHVHTHWECPCSCAPTCLSVRRSCVVSHCSSELYRRDSSHGSRIRLPLVCPTWTLYWREHIDRYSVSNIHAGQLRVILLVILLIGTRAHQCNSILTSTMWHGRECVRAWAYSVSVRLSILMCQTVHA